MQGSFVSDKEVQNVVDYLINHSERVSYNNELEEHMVTNIVSSGNECRQVKTVMTVIHIL